MSHLVIYRGSGGNPAYHQVEDVHDAVAFVEKLRNDEGIEGARIVRMEEVNFEYRPYFRVELTGGESTLGSAPVRPAVGAAEFDDTGSGHRGSAERSITDEAPSALGSSDTEPDAHTESDDTSDADHHADSQGDVDDEGVRVPGSSDEPRPFGGEAGNGVGARRGLFGR